MVCFNHFPCLQQIEKTMYRQFTKDEDKSPYEPTLCDLRRHLFQNLPSPVKDAILLVKYWRKHRLSLRGNKPEARFYELLVIHCWDVAGNPRMFNIAAALKSVFTSLSSWKDISITWEGSSCLAYQLQISGGKKREIMARLSNLRNLQYRYYLFT